MSDQLKRRARIKIDLDLLADMLGLEPGVQIRGILPHFPDFMGQFVEVFIEGGSLPVVAGGEMTPEIKITYTKHSSGSGASTVTASWSHNPDLKWESRSLLFSPSPLLDPAVC